MHNNYKKALLVMGLSVIAGGCRLRLKCQYPPHRQTLKPLNGLNYAPT